jgi:nicotinamide-nucleotide amidase
MTATLLTVGDELLIGQVINTNAAWLGERLTAIGLHVNRVITVGDEDAEIHAGLQRGLADSEVLICTGGLGPTHDDVTKRAVAQALGRPLARRAELVDHLAERYRQRGRELPEAAYVMADVPRGFEALENPVGAAPGLWFRGAVPGVPGLRAIVIVPGVPFEMRAIMEASVLPRLVELQGESAIVQKTILTVGHGESDLAARLGDLDEWLGDGLRLAFLPNYGTVRLRITALGDDRSEAGSRLATFENFVRDRLGDAVFGEGDRSLEEVVGEMLRQRGLRLATAESCTGGRVADAITNVAGASGYYSGGVVVYGNPSKIDLLGVSRGALQEEGAVSEAVARQMAAGVREALKTDIGLSTTGIAGPSGGTPDKPVGTIWLGYADEGGTHAVRLHLTPDRTLNKRLSVTAALNLIRRQILRRDRQPGNHVRAPLAPENES